MQSTAITVKDYLAELEPERRRAISAVRRQIRASLPKGYKEVMGYGMISYVVPLKLYPAGYLNDPTVPLPYVSLASQKRHMAVYMMGLYGNVGLNEWFEKAYKATGKRFDMGKCCVRFRTLDDLPLDLIGEAVAKVTPQQMIDAYESARSPRK